MNMSFSSAASARSSSFSIFEGLKSCRLCWRITGLLFLVFLVVEAFALFLSAESYRTEQLRQVEREGLVVARAILRAAQAQSGFAPLSFARSMEELGPALRQNSVLVGFSAGLTGSRTASFGESPRLLREGAARLRRSADGSRLDVRWSSAQLGFEGTVAARLDTSHVSELVVAYIWRVLGVVLMISAALTVTSMLVIERLMLRPIRVVNAAVEEACQDPTEAARALGKLAEQREGTDEWRQLRRNLRGLGNELDRAFRDIAIQNRKLAEAEKVQAVSAAKSAFLANVSHDLRTPLNAIIGFGEILQAKMFGPLGDPRYEEYADDIVASGVSLKTLVDDLLDLGRIETGTYRLNPDRLDLRDLIGRSIRQAEAANRTPDKKPVIFSYPEGLNAVRVWADERALKQVLDNLVVNSLIHAGPAAQTTVEVREDVGGRIILEVRDDGVGLPDHLTARAPEPYFQAGGEEGRNPQHARRGGGFGLGLSIVKALSDAMGLDFELRRAHDNGALVRIWLRKA